MPNDRAHSVPTTEEPIAGFDGHLEINGRHVILGFEVFGDRKPGAKATYSTPGEFSYIDIRRVRCNGRDVTDLLNDEDFADVFYSALYRR